MSLGSLGMVVLAASALLAYPKDEQSLQETSAPLERRVEKMLGVTLKTSVPASYVTREDLGQRFARMIDRQIPTERRAGALQLYRLLGLVPADFDIASAVDLMKTAARGLYDAETGRLYVVQADLEEGVLKGIIFHELIHAVQDQEHNLSRRFKELAEGHNTDRLSAFNYLVEGEAFFWGDVINLQIRGQDFDKLPSIAKSALFGLGSNVTTPGIIRALEINAASMPELKPIADSVKKSPPLLVRMQFEPALRGKYLAYRVYEKEGREGFRAMFKNSPPQCTRDAMFVDQWLKAPRRIAVVHLASLQEALGREWKMIHEDTVGALTLHTMFEDQRRQADAIAEAWDGDRVQVWKNGDDFLLMGVVVFASPEAASLCASELKRVYEEKWVQGKKVTVRDSLITHLSAGPDQLVVQLIEKTVILCRGALPTEAAKLTGALSKSKIE